MPKKLFPRVAEAREALADLAKEITGEYIALAKEARAAGKYDVAEEILWKLIEHMPKDETGATIIDSSAAEPQPVIVAAPEQKTLHIGGNLILGGMPGAPVPKAIEGETVNE